MWDHRPSGYPDRVPFVDPNNGCRSNGSLSVKPKKDILEEMFTFLKQEYLKKVFYAIK